MDRIKILFLIHDLGQGGAEKVLVNLVNNIDSSRFDISLVALFGGGMNIPFLKPHIHFRTVFRKALPGNSHLMKLLTPSQLHWLCVKGEYDIEVSYLEGPSARIISGCPSQNTKLVSWIHVEQHTMERVAQSFRTIDEARKCYRRFDQTVCVSQYVQKDFTSLVELDKPCTVKYNTVESEMILESSMESAPELVEDGKKRLIAVGTLKQVKGYDRLLHIMKRFQAQKRPVHLYILGIGPMQAEIEKYIEDNHLRESITLLGYQNNPYKYVTKCDLFLCASRAEGFSTAATEALIVGTPVCTVEVSGMKEMLGEDNNYGIITDNDEESLYHGICQLLDDPELLWHYCEQAKKRGKDFSTVETTRAVERMFVDLL